MSQIYKVLRKVDDPFSSLYTEFVASVKGKWAWQKEEYVDVPTNCNVNLADLFWFVSASDDLFFSKEPKYQFLFLDNTLRIANVFFNDMDELLTNFETTCPERFYKPVYKLLISEELSQIRQSSSDSSREIWFPENMMKRSMTFAMFMDIIHRNDNLEASYVIKKMDEHYLMD